MKVFRIKPEDSIANGILNLVLMVMDLCKHKEDRSTNASKNTIFAGHETKHNVI